MVTAFWRLDTLGGFSSIFYKEDNGCDSMFAFASTSEKRCIGYTSFQKGLGMQRCKQKVFSFRVDPFTEWGKMIERFASPESVPMPLSKSTR